MTQERLLVGDPRLHNAYMGDEGDTAMVFDGLDGRRLSERMNKAMMDGKYGILKRLVLLKPNDPESYLLGLLDRRYGGCALRCARSL